MRTHVSDAVGYLIAREFPMRSEGRKIRASVDLLIALETCQSLATPWAMI